MPTGLDRMLYDGSSRVIRSRAPVRMSGVLVRCRERWHEKEGGGAVPTDCFNPTAPTSLARGQLRLLIDQLRPALPLGASTPAGSRKLCWSDPWTGSNASPPLPELPPRRTPTNHSPPLTPLPPRRLDPARHRRHGARTSRPPQEQRGRLAVVDGGAEC